jgi:glycosyltransferase involved in cell wall biosynthesis
MVSVSVVIATYNAAPFIEQTIESVLSQTTRADEVLVLDDGSTDDTRAVLRRYKKSVTVIEQKNEGVARARNRLCSLARGDLVAFLDHDDVWHPRYLQVQRVLARDFPNAAACFTGHMDFATAQPPAWQEAARALDSIVIDRRQFMGEYMRDTSRFASMSYCAIPRAVLADIGPEPFLPSVSGADDYYLMNLLPLVGPVVYHPGVLVAYRFTEGAQSSDQLKNCTRAVQAMSCLHGRYRACGDGVLLRQFEDAYASKSRHLAKVLMGVGGASQARGQLWRSLLRGQGASSRIKTAALLAATFLPSAAQPQWPSAQRAREQHP